MIGAPLVLVYVAFLDLGTTRPLVAGAIGPIPWTAIDAYARRAGVTDPDQFERLVALIGAADAAWLSKVNAQSG